MYMHGVFVMYAVYLWVYMYVCLYGMYIHVDAYTLCVHVVDAFSGFLGGSLGFSFFSSSAVSHTQLAPSAAVTQLCRKTKLSPSACQQKGA